MTKKNQGIKTKQAFLTHQFEIAAKQPTVWQVTARELICAANVLYERYDGIYPLLCQQKEDETINPDIFYSSSKPFMVLYGLAIENLIKGLIIAKGTNATINGKLNKCLENHNLKNLFKLAAISISEKDNHLLERLQRFIESGKYPIDKTPRLSAKINDSIGHSFSRKDISHIGDLMKLLEKELHALDHGFDPIDLLSLCKKTNTKCKHWFSYFNDIKSFFKRIFQKNV
jgi:hypothetical protein